MSDEVVTDREHGLSAALVAGGEGVKLGAFHLDREDAVARHLLVKIGAFVIENIRGIDAANMDG